MKPSLKIFVSILLVGALSSLLLALFDHAHSGKWLSSAGLMFDIAGIAQLDIGTFFQVLLDRYSDDEKYPKGLHHTSRVGSLLSSTPISQFAVGSTTTCSTNIEPGSTCLSWGLSSS
jgi:hypothetical protein